MCFKIRNTLHRNVWITISALSDDLKEGVKAAVKELLLNTKNKHRYTEIDVESPDKMR